MAKAHWGRLLLLVVFVVAVVSFFYFDGSQYLSLEYLKESRNQLRHYYATSPLVTVSLFVLIYILSTSLLLPGATVLTLASGFIFGIFYGLIIASAAATLGAVIAFLAGRFLLRDYIERKFKHRIEAIDHGVEKEGALYLFTLRLIPVFPFFVINVAMGITQMPLWTYFWVSFIGMIPGTFVYVNAGTQISQIEEVSGLLSPTLIFSFLALAALPWVGKLIVQSIKHKKIYKGFKRPRHFDYNLIVIGAGSGGLVSAYIASTLKARTALIEKNKMGGDCLNTGCVPSKSLIASAKAAHTIRQADRFGIKASIETLDFESAMGRVQSVIKTIEPHDSVQRYQNLGVDCLQGEAQVLSPWSVQLGEKLLTARNLVIATGASPSIPKLKGLDEVKALTSENLWELKKLPQRLVVLGGGAIGCEMAQAFARLGSKVALVERGPRLLAKEDEAVSTLMEQQLKTEGIQLYLGFEAESFKTTGEARYVFIRNADGGSADLEFDEVLIALGRTPRSQGFGLEELGVETDERGQIRHNKFMQTNIPNIFTCGDVAGPYQLTHMASHQAYYATINALFGRMLHWLPSVLLKSLMCDESVLPWATFTDPEVATVGLTEKEARSREVDYKLTTYQMSELDRALTDDETKGFVRVLTSPGSDKILGATIVSAHAAEMITEFISAMKYGKGLNNLLGTIHIYPTYSEANKALAGRWKTQHKPENLLKKAEAFFRWQRS